MPIAIRLNKDERSICFDVKDQDDSCYMAFMLNRKHIVCSGQPRDDFEPITDLTEDEWWLVLEEIKKYILRKREDA